MKKNQEGQIISVKSGDLLELLSTWTAIKDQKTGAPPNIDKYEQLVRDMMLMLTRNNVPTGIEVQLGQFAQFMDKNPLEIISAIMILKQVQGLPDKNQSADSIQSMYQNWLKVKARYNIDGQTFSRLANNFPDETTRKLTVSSMEKNIVSLINDLKASGKFAPNPLQSASLNFIQRAEVLAESYADATRESIEDLFKRIGGQGTIRQQIKVQRARLEKIQKDLVTTRNFIEDNETAFKLQEEKVNNMTSEYEAIKAAGGQDTDPNFFILEGKLKQATEQLEIHIKELERLKAEETEMLKIIKQIQDNLTILYKKLR